MIERKTAIDLMSRGVGKYFNEGRRPMIRFTMSNTRRREVTTLIERDGIEPTCMEEYECPVTGRPWSHADGIHVMRVHNGRITGRRNRKRRKRKAA
jgi:hypothetical protein